MNKTDDKIIKLAHISRPHGVHGAVILTAYNDDPTVILNGRDLLLTPPPESGEAVRPIVSLKGKEAAQGLIVKIKNVSTREAAEALRGWGVAILRKNLPPTGDDEFYLADLIGLTALDAASHALGLVENFMETGAGVILSLRLADGREELVPLADEFIDEIDLKGGSLRVINRPGEVGI